MQRFSSTAERTGRSRTACRSAISSRTGVVRLISIGLGAHGITISSAYRSADRAMAPWSSICGASMITTSSSPAMSGRRRCSSRDGSATIRNGKAACGAASRGSMAARSDHSRALPEGSASTSRTLLPARANTCASQTAEVVLPVPGLRLAKARLRPVIQAVCQQQRCCGQAGAAAAINARRWPVRQPGDIVPAAYRGTVLHSLWTAVEKITRRQQAWPRYRLPMGAAAGPVTGCAGRSRQTLRCCRR